MSHIPTDLQWADLIQRIKGAGTNIDVDAALSTTSTNPVQNRVITAALNGKLAVASTAPASPSNGDMILYIGTASGDFTRTGLYQYNGTNWVFQNLGIAYSAGANVDITNGVISATDTTYGDFAGATSEDDGEAGLVPAPTTADEGKFLKGDGTWGTPENTTYSAGTGLNLSGTTFNINFDATPTAGSNTGVTSGGVYSAIAAAVSSVYKPAGSVATVAELPTLGADVLGNVYNFTQAFTTTADFVEGAGVQFPAGTNVAVVNTGTEQNPVYKFDDLAGIIDLSNYVTNTTYATTSSVGVVKIGDGLNVTAAGEVSVNNFTNSEWEALWV